MSTKIKVPAKVVDKRKKNGLLSFLFGPSYYITLKFTGVQIAGRVREYPVPASQYYDMEAGEEYIITLYKHSDGLYYNTPE